MYVKNVYEEFYGQMYRIDDYFRVRKAERLNEMPSMLFGFEEVADVYVHVNPRAGSGPNETNYHFIPATR